MKCQGEGTLEIAQADMMVGIEIEDYVSPDCGFGSGSVAPFMSLLLKSRCAIN